MVAGRAHLSAEWRPKGSPWNEMPLGSESGSRRSGYRPMKWDRHGGRSLPFVQAPVPRPWSKSRKIRALIDHRPSRPQPADSESQTESARPPILPHTTQRWARSTTDRCKASSPAIFGVRCCLGGVLTLGAKGRRYQVPSETKDPEENHPMLNLMPPNRRP